MMNSIVIWQPLSSSTSINSVSRSWNVLPANSKQRLSQRLTEIAPDGSAINEDTQVLFLRSLKVSVFTKATFSQTLQKVHVLSGPVQNALCIDSQGTVVRDLKIKVWHGKEIPSGVTVELHFLLSPEVNTNSCYFMCNSLHSHKHQNTHSHVLKHTASHFE